ncbi:MULTISPECIES: hypothetical protein [Telluribacter]|uniref:hypothetical protein n=1 Tax=Telluribacter TaxID=1949218 RepID=UPI001A96CBF9|nr:MULTISPECIES: hypothetical protein [Telluribacter]
MNEPLKWLFLLLILEAASILADYLIKKASLLAGFSGWGWLLLGGILYGSTALGWFIMMRSFKIFTLGVLHSFGVIALSLALSVFVFDEKITWREVAGIGLGCVSIGLLIRFR